MFNSGVTGNGKVLVYFEEGFDGQSLPDEGYITAVDEYFPHHAVGKNFPDTIIRIDGVRYRVRNVRVVQNKVAVWAYNSKRGQTMRSKTRKLTGGAVKVSELYHWRESIPYVGFQNAQTEEWLTFEQAVQLCK